MLKANHPTLHALVKHLPWKVVPLMDRTRTGAHGRDEIRRLKAVTLPRLPFPHAGQALQIVRRRRRCAPGRCRRTRLRGHQPDSTPGDSLTWPNTLRGHWAIEES
ncbi:hypothetical protein [Streptomyces sp. NPDC001123]